MGAAVRSLFDKALRRLEEQTLAAQMNEGFPLMPGFLKEACAHKVGAYEAIQASPAWSAFMTPFPIRATAQEIDAEFSVRFDGLKTAMTDLCDAHSFVLFMSILAASATQEPQKVQGKRARPGRSG